MSATSPHESSSGSTHETLHDSVHNSRTHSSQHSKQSLDQDSDHHTHQHSKQHSRQASPQHSPQPFGLRATAPEFVPDMAPRAYNEADPYSPYEPDQQPAAAIPLYGPLHGEYYYPQLNMTSLGNTLEQAVNDVHMHGNQQYPMCNQYAPENQSISSAEQIATIENMPASKKQALQILCRCNGRSVWMPASALDPDHTCKNTGAPQGGLPFNLPPYLENAYVSLIPPGFSRTQPSEPTNRPKMSYAAAARGFPGPNIVSSRPVEDVFVSPDSRSGPYRRAPAVSPPRQSGMLGLSQGHQAESLGRTPRRQFETSENWGSGQYPSSGGH